MAFRWSTSQIIAEHKTLQATSLAISSDAIHCALSSKREISIIKLDSPSNVCKKIKRNSKWESTTSEFNPIDKKQLAITNAHMIQIYLIDTNVNISVSNHSFDNSFASDKTSSPSSYCSSSSSDSLLLTCRGHTRTVTDLNWSPFDSDLIASSSYDSYVYIWDLKDSRRPVITMSSVAGASQVKWSRMNEYTLASCHEGDVRIWDTRKSNTPSHYITAHLSKIYGLDWNPNAIWQFATCSQDGTVRVSFANGLI